MRQLVQRLLVVILAALSMLSLCGCSKLTKLIIINYRSTPVTVELDGHSLDNSIASASYVRDRVYLGETLVVVAKDPSGRAVFSKRYASADVIASTKGDEEFFILIK